MEASLRALPLIVAAGIASLAAAPGLANEAPASAKAEPGISVTLSRHHTSNALDTIEPLDDGFTTLRGSIDHAIEHDLGETRVTAQLEGRRYDTFRIEDDLSLALGAATTLRPSNALELRGALTWTVVDRGEEFQIGPLLIGSRERRHTIGSEVTAGIRLDPETVLVAGVAASREKIAPTRFQDDLIPPARLEADRTRVAATVSVTRSRGPFSWGAAAGSALLRDDASAALPALTLGDHSARLLAAVDEPGRYALAAGIGVGLVHLRDTPFRALRPVYQLAGELELGKGFSLRGTVEAGFETVETDDPLVSYARRMEVEAGYRAGPRTRIGLGVFRETRENFFLDYADVLHGLYAEAEWRAHRRLSLLVRIDARRHRVVPFDADRETIETQVALTAHL